MGPEGAVRPEGDSGDRHADPQTRRAAERAGFDRFLVKPLMFTALLSAIHDLLPGDTARQSDPAESGR